MRDSAIIVQLIYANGEKSQIGGVQLDIRFYVRKRLRYSFNLGCTEDDGACRSSLAHVQKQLESNRKLFLMDYNTPLDDCNSLVGIVAPTDEELAERRAAREKWFGASDDGYVTNHSITCDEQRFELKREADNHFNLVCHSNSTMT